MLLPKLNFEEEYNFPFRQDKGKYFIYDVLRKKWLLLTLEEWVRQHWIHYFIGKGTSICSLITEKKIVVNNTTKRIDLMLLNKTGVEYLLECKTPLKRIHKEHFEQAARYNSTVKAEKLIISNGLEHFVAEFKNESYAFDTFRFS